MYYSYTMSVCLSHATAPFYFTAQFYAAKPHHRPCVNFNANAPPIDTVRALSCCGEVSLGGKQIISMYTHILFIDDVCLDLTQPRPFFSQRKFTLQSPTSGHVSCVHCSTDGMTMLAGAADGSLRQHRYEVLMFSG